MVMPSHRVKQQVGLGGPLKRRQVRRPARSPRAAASGASRSSAARRPRGGEVVPLRDFRAAGCYTGDGLAEAELRTNIPLKGGGPSSRKIDYKDEIEPD